MNSSRGRNFDTQHFHILYIPFLDLVHAVDVLAAGLEVSTVCLVLEDSHMDCLGDCWLVDRWARGCSHQFQLEDTLHFLVGALLKIMSLQIIQSDY